MFLSEPTKPSPDPRVVEWPRAHEPEIAVDPSGWDALHQRPLRQAPPSRLIERLSASESCRFGRADEDCEFESALCCREHSNRQVQRVEWRIVKLGLAPQAGLEPAALRLTAGCSAIELVRVLAGCCHDTLSNVVSENPVSLR
jgi:hypothetical protein